MFLDLANRFADVFSENAAEFSMSMMNDCPSEYTSFEEVSNTMEDSIASFSDAHLEEYLKEFNDLVRTLIAKKKVKVHRVVLSEEGFYEADYTIQNGS